MAIGVLSFALPAPPAQVPPVPTLPPISVTTTTAVLTTEVTVAPPTVGPTTAVTVPSTDTLLDDPSTQSGVGSDSTPAPAPSSPSSEPIGGAIPTPTPVPARPSADGLTPRPRPLVRQPATRLLAAAGDTAGEFAPTGAVAALMGLFLLANGVIRRRDDLAHVQLDDRDAIVRFD